MGERGGGEGERGRRGGRRERREGIERGENLKLNIHIAIPWRHPHVNRHLRALFHAQDVSK
jgi:hypothetical protein